MCDYKKQEATLLRKPYEYKFNQNLNQMKQNLRKLSLWALVFAVGCLSYTAHARTGEKSLEDRNVITQQPAASPLTLTVLDQETGQPVVGAMITIKGTQKAVVTDVDGKTSISAPVGADLVVSYIGYLAQTIKVTDKSDYIVYFKEDAILMDQVVVIGFGTQKKADLTGSVSMVDMEKVLGDRPMTNVINTLQGTIPGLVITGGSQPGVAKSFNIRGTTSLNGGGPLVLIDNVPGDINMINPEDVATVTILKDASSAAIYGARAAFGVILITTKKANKGSKLTLNYNDNFAFQTPTNIPQQYSVHDMLSAYKDAEFGGKGSYWNGQNLDRWIGYVDDYDSKAYLTNGNYSQDAINSINKNGYFTAEDGLMYYLRGNSEFEDMTDPYGFQQIHNVSASGGSDKITYRVSLGYTDQNGPLVTKKDSYSRINVTSYVSADITKWLNTSLDIRYAKGKRSNPTGGLYSLLHPSLYPNGYMDIGGVDYPVNTPENMIRLQTPTLNVDENPRIFSSTKITPVKGLEAVFEYTYDAKTNVYTAFNDQLQYVQGTELALNKTGLTKYDNNKSNTAYNAINAYATYDVSTRNEKHNFKIMAGYSQESRYNHALNVGRTEAINNSLPSITGSTGEITATDKTTEYSTRSGFFRFNYGFDDRYLVAVSGRYDGSSKFPTDTRFGFFPSVSAGWQLANEKFMDWSDSWLNEFKIRAAWGQIGNQAISEYAYIPDMESYKVNWINGGNQVYSLKMPGLVRSDFTWEIVETLDIAVDMSLFNNRLTASLGWYQRDTKGMLAPGFELPAVVGASAPQQNVADLRTRGWELSMNWRDNIGSDWNYSVGFNFFDSRSYITKYDNASGLFWNDNETRSDPNNNPKRWRKGMEIGEIWGFQNDGFYTVDDFVDTKDWKLKDGVTSIKGNNNLRPGDVKFKNLNDFGFDVNTIDEGDGTVYNPGDRKVIGNNTPRFQYGINGSFGWKGLELSFFFQGTGQRDVWINNALTKPFETGHFSTIYEGTADYWKPVDKDAGNWAAQKENPRFGRIYGGNNNAGSNQRMQDKYLSNAAYIRLKNATISYSVPQWAMKKIGLAGAKVFVSGENLWTWSELPKGIDPEQTGWTYPNYMTISFGISLTL